MNEQIEMSFDDAFDWKGIIRRHWPTLLEAIRHAADQRGRKQVAHDLKISTAVLDNLLADRGRHNLKMKLLPYFLMNDQGDIVAEAICKLRGGRFVRERKATPEEQLAALKAAVRGMGAVGDQLLQMAGVQE